MKTFFIPGLRHGFTNPDANSFAIDKLKYDAEAGEAIRLAMQGFFREVF